MKCYIMIIMICITDIELEGIYNRDNKRGGGKKNIRKIIRCPKIVLGVLMRSPADAHFKLRKNKNTLNEDLPFLKLLVA